jgi:phage terminase large subunit GpA-like protein
MIKAAPQLKAKYRENDSSKLELQFENMYISIAGANSPSSLASKPIRYLFLDEVDKYPGASKKEADPISLAQERTKTFPNRKICKVSTPTLKTGPIWKAKEAADIEKHYFVPCPHCGEYIEFKFAQLKWPGKEGGLSNADRADMAYYECQECGCIITDADKMRMLRAGKWRVVRQNSKTATKVAFWINTFYSPFVRFSQIAREFMDSKDDPEKLQNFINSWLAEPWEDTKLKTSADLVMERQKEIPEYVLPEWTKLLTAGVDVQENCLYWTVRAWGDFITSQNIAHGQAFSFSDIEKVMNLEYKKPSGDPMLVELALIDSGDQTDEVYDFCALNSDWALPAKGVDTQLSHYRLSSVNKTESKAYGMNLVLVDGGKYKDMIASRMRKDHRKEEEAKGSWMVYKGCDREYAEQVTAEHKIIERSAGGRENIVWRLKTSHAANHYLDAEVYCMAAADVKGVRSLFLQNAPEEKPNPQPSKKAEQHAPEEDWIGKNENWI